MASYTQLQIDNFWWGVGGSASSIQPGAYVLMREEEIIARVTLTSSQYDANFAAILGYLYANKTTVSPTGASGFGDTSKCGSNPWLVLSTRGDGWKGPTKS